MSRPQKGTTGLVYGALANYVASYPGLYCYPHLKKFRFRCFVKKTMTTVQVSTVLPTKSDSDVIFCLQLLS